jgi:hypothetical protein
MIYSITNIGASAEGAEIITFSTTFDVSFAVSTVVKKPVLSTINIYFIPFQVAGFLCSNTDVFFQKLPFLTSTVPLKRP